MINENSTRDEVLKKVRQNGYALRYASAELRGDRKVVMTAVKQNGRALRFASELLRGDREIVIEALKLKDFSLFGVSIGLRNDPEFMLETFKASLRVLSNASYRLHCNKKFLKQILRLLYECIRKEKPIEKTFNSLFCKCQNSSHVRFSYQILILQILILVMIVGFWVV